MYWSRSPRMFITDCSSLLCLPLTDNVKIWSFNRWGRNDWSKWEENCCWPFTLSGAMNHISVMTMLVYSSVKSQDNDSLDWHAEETSELGLIQSSVLLDLTRIARRGWGNLPSMLKKSGSVLTHHWNIGRVEVEEWKYQVEITWNNQLPVIDASSKSIGLSNIWSDDVFLAECPNRIDRWMCSFLHISHRHWVGWSRFPWSNKDHKWFDRDVDPHPSMTRARRHCRVSSEWSAAVRRVIASTVHWNDSSLSMLIFSLICRWLYMHLYSVWPLSSIGSEMCRQSGRTMNASIWHFFSLRFFCSSLVCLCPYSHWSSVVSNIIGSNSLRTFVCWTVPQRLVRSQRRVSLLVSSVTNISFNLRGDLLHQMTMWRSVEKDDETEHPVHGNFLFLRNFQNVQMKKSEEIHPISSSLSWGWRWRELNSSQPWRFSRSKRISWLSSS